MEFKGNARIVEFIKKDGTIQRAVAYDNEQIEAFTNYNKVLVRHINSQDQETKETSLLQDGAFRLVRNMFAKYKAIVKPNTQDKAKWYYGWIDKTKDLTGQEILVTDKMFSVNKRFPNCYNYYNSTALYIDKEDVELTEQIGYSDL